MTASSPMSREELLELAALDAFGLLDDYEAALYTRSFHHAPAAVQDEIRELQAQLAADVAILPEVEPSPDLRERVLQRVARAIEEESSSMAPLATIGARRHQPDQHADDDRDTIGRLRLTSTGHFWRAATFALCAGLIVVLYLWSESARYNHELSRLALDNNTVQQLEQMIGPTAKDYLLSPATEFIVLTGNDPDAEYGATLLIREGEDHGLLIMKGLPPHAESPNEPIYSLTVRNGDGEAVQVARFAGSHRLTGLRVEVNTAALGSDSVWEISGPEGVLLASA